jgi:hypothetical protein
MRVPPLFVAALGRCPGGARRRRHLETLGGKGTCGGIGRLLAPVLDRRREKRERDDEDECLVYPKVEFFSLSLHHINLWTHA